jgi:hypothetical protein
MEASVRELNLQEKVCGVLVEWDGTLAGAERTADAVIALCMEEAARKVYEIAEEVAEMHADLPEDEDGCNYGWSAPSMVADIFKDRIAPEAPASK